MAALEITIIIIGLVLIFASFFVSEKLSPKEIEKLAGLTKEEMNQMVTKEIGKAEDKIKDTIDEQIEESVVKVSRDMEKVSNDKISSISEFSDSVLDIINKNHSQVMFLYDMLSNKEEELKSSVIEALSVNSNLNLALAQAEETVVSVQESVNVEHLLGLDAFAEGERERVTERVVEKEEVPAIRSFFIEHSEATREAATTNNNDAILSRYRKGKTVIQIAKELGLGQGEVKLVIDLYEGGRR